ncbi:MAG TPA: 6-phosphofructokinase [Bacteroidales bacterium]|nr:6-phosphofructokinase [Rikenellaceae bacterium]HON54612.1 6-phosphofructokinase [Bacteroidales bacterium]HRR48830.1 6-phosphofructokinase [Bacteroidales bacterium]HRT33409.1 6-phosphofructokinase [Bacteroidales bacterium]HRT83878.1 6-phosphofructokinase [Bacteroidales bacterium]
MNSKRKINRIGVLTSGGDAPGMNAAIRAVVRTAIYNQLEVIGIIRGYSGLLEKQFMGMQSHSVSKIISQGGTILKSSRCPEFKNRSVREKAIENLQEAGIDALVVIGGDGSFRGANLLCKEFNYPVIGIPGTIDNDIYGTDFTIGFDTAINTAVSAVDKLRDTADSHNMIFFVEVMGRDAGFIALNTAIASGAEATLLPEVHTDIDKLCSFMERDRRKNKTSGIIIVAEGEEEGGAMEVASKVRQKLPNYEIRVTTLGHIQRGGSPTCNDRVLASLLGYEAVNALLKGRTNVMVGQMQNQVVYTPFEEACTRHNEINKTWYEISRILSL